MQITPVSLRAGSPGFSLSVTLGRNYYGGTSLIAKPTWVVLWNGSRRTTHYSASTNSISADIPAADIAHPGFYQVSVLDTETGQVYSGTQTFVVPADINAVDFAYDGERNKFYVAVPPNGSRPNAPAGSIAVVDAASGKVGPAFFAGATPNRLAISDDARYLYVAAADGITQVDLNTLTVASHVMSIKTGSILDMAVMPGANSTLAVLYAAQYYNDGTITIFDNAVPRANSSSDHIASRLLFTDPNTLVIGGGNQIQMQKVAVSAAGIGNTIASATRQDVPDCTGDGLIYSTTGDVFDSNLNLIGQTGLVGGGTFVPGRGRLLALNTVFNQSGFQLNAFDESTLEALGYLPFSQPLSLSFQVFGLGYASQRLVSWGNSGIAFLAQTEFSTSLGQLIIAQPPLAGPAPAWTAASVVNAATLRSGSIAPGEILSFYGTSLGPASGRSLEFSQPGLVSSVLGGTQVWFDGLPGIMLYSGSGQANVVAPFGLAGHKSTKVQVWYGGIPSPSISLNVTSTAPGIFTQDGSGAGPAALVNGDGSLDRASKPAAPGDVVTLFGTGGGVTNPPSQDGVPAEAADNLAAQMNVLLNGQSIPVIYAGAAPGLVAGVIQVNFRIPADFTGKTPVNVQLQAGSTTSPAGVTMAVK